MIGGRRAIVLFHNLPFDGRLLGIVRGSPLCACLCCTIPGYHGWGICQIDWSYVSPKRGSTAPLSERYLFSPEACNENPYELKFADFVRLQLKLNIM